ncbi:MAG: prepilin-type N-terminal cleavage/methylation domain-containing protein [Proteobacteria bacterium]|nr:MAG: prepilin-type N-terminal cleavage/methylation domain-containing protein [Pseudomonadota bacterium]
MKNVKKNSQAGFSLVELMVVVAIIGILASLAIPSVGKYMAKARQSEAKTQLSSMYTAEKAFYAEYSAYHTMFGAIGYSPEGKLRYVVGFGGAGAPDADGTNGYLTVPTGAGTSLNTLTYCGVAVTMANGCQLLSGATNVPPAAGDLPATALSGTAFIAGAGAIVFAQGAVGTVDQWTINQNKNILNTQPGIL